MDFFNSLFIAVEDDIYDNQDFFLACKVIIDVVDVMTLKRF